MFFDEFFYMHKSDRKTILFMLVIAVGAMLVCFHEDGKDVNSDDIVADSMRFSSAPAAVQQKAPVYYQVEEQRVERFIFDPNTADSTQLLRLGLQPWQVRNIYKYRAAGGIYRRKEDFARLYGLTVKQYRELEPYIRISSDYLPASTLVSKPDRVGHDTLRYPVKLSAGETIDLCTADTTVLRRVPGIGSYYAQRIVAYGERLGGYVNTGQLQEIDGFPAESLPYFAITESHPHKLNVNKLSESELKRHPYINYYQARAIMDYRRRHGRINDLDDLHLLRDFTPEQIGRLRPYVEY